MRSLIQIFLIAAIVGSPGFAAADRSTEGQLVWLPDQRAEIPWPTDTWPRGQTPPALARVMDDIIKGAEPGTPADTRALLVIKGGELIGERYGEGFGPNSRFQSWSMAKSVVHALVGILVRDGQIDIYAPAKVPRWNRKVNDPRAAITVENLLRMESGLTFSESYTDPEASNVLQMLFGRGRLDTAEYAAGQPLEAEPGTLWHYSSGTANILSGIVRDTIGANSAQEYRDFMAESLFQRIGITSAIPEFDAAHNFIGSSYVHMTAQDWARFGLLYLRGGVWDGQRVLPEHWADHARFPTLNAHGAYGAHFWLNEVNPETGQPAITPRIPTDAFMPRGFGAQVVLLIPSLDLIIVYLGQTYDEAGPVIEAIADLVDAAQ